MQCMWCGSYIVQINAICNCCWYFVCSFVIFVSKHHIISLIFDDRKLWQVNFAYFTVLTIPQIESSVAVATVTVFIVFIVSKYYFYFQSFCFILILKANSKLILSTQIFSRHLLAPLLETFTMQFPFSLSAYSLVH